MALRLPWRVAPWLQRAAFLRARFVAAADVTEVGGGQETATLIAAGDLDVSDEINAVVGTEGPAAVLVPLAKVLADADLRVANLESMLTRATAANGTMGAFLRADPETVALLEHGGFDAVTVANNHCMDFGGAALVECLAHLETHGIAACGGGADQAAARRPARLEARGITVGMLGYCDDYRGDPAAVDEPGPAPAIEALILEDVRALRAQVDLVIVQLHIGYEFQLHPLPHDRDLARRVADEGADLVFCHHAHVPMALERRGKSLIAHGLGNLVRPPSEYLRSGHPLSDHSLVLRVGFNKKGVTRARIIPVGIDGLAVRPLEGAERATLLGTLALCARRLDDNEMLGALWRDRLAREARDIATNASSPEMARHLESPRQARLVRALCGHENDAARQLGCLLRDGAASAAPQVAQLARSFVRSYGLATVLPGTTP